MELVIEELRFRSSSGQCAATLTRPDRVGRPPLLVMGHGLGATHEMGLQQYAKRFAQAGIASLAFTYRHFGDSSGWPRQLLSVGRQLDDWRSALRGTSFGGRTRVGDGKPRSRAAGRRGSMPIHRRRCVDNGDTTAYCRATDTARVA